MKKAMYSGSFDPITFGHLDIIERASKIFDELYVAIGISTTKNYLLSLEEREELVKKVCSKFSNVKVISYDSLAVDFAKKNNIQYIVRGLRAVTDFEYELQMTDTNKVLNPNIETIFMMANKEYSYVSSSVCKEVLRFNGDISKFVPKEVESYLKLKMS